jgi:hypothetical protein
MTKNVGNDEGFAKGVGICECELLAQRESSPFVELGGCVLDFFNAGEWCVA